MTILVSCNISVLFAAGLEAAEDKQSGRGVRSEQEVERDMPRVNKSLYGLLTDLGKVKRLALYHT